jgi:hypothetical protein
MKYAGRDSLAGELTQDLDIWLRIITGTKEVAERVGGWERNRDREGLLTSAAQRRDEAFGSGTLNL